MRSSNYKAKKLKTKNIKTNKIYSWSSKGDLINICQDLTQIWAQLQDMKLIEEKISKTSSKVIDQISKQMNKINTKINNSNKVKPCNGVSDLIQAKQ